MTRPTRNYAGIQFEGLRRQIDEPFHELHDELEEAYYGDRLADGSLDRSTGWIAGISKPWQGFHKQATPAASKALFDRLHGLLFAMRELFFHKMNLQRAVPYPRDQYDEYDEDGPDATVVTRSRLADERARVREFRTSRPAEFAKLVAALQGKGVEVDPDATD